MSRAYVTNELIELVKELHKKHPGMNYGAIGKKVGCSGTTVSRILAGKYDKKVDVDEVLKNIRTDIYVDKNGKLHPVIPDEKPDRDENFVYDGELDPKTCKGKLASKPCKDEDSLEIDTSNSFMSEILKVIVDILAGTPKSSMPAAPIPDERFKYEVLTELKTIRETEVDAYKELKQLKGILADIRDMLK